MVYLLLLIISLVGAYLYVPPSNSNNLDRLYKFLLISTVLVFGLRYRVGIDTLNYIENFRYSPTLGSLRLSDFNSSTAPLFILLMATCKSLFNDFVLFQLVHNIFINVVIFQFLRKHCINPFWGVSLYFIMIGLYFNTEILKESYAICFFLLAYTDLKEHNWPKYYLMATIAVLFHYGAAVLYAVPFIMSLRFNKKLLVIAATFFLLLTTLVTFVFSRISIEAVQDRVMKYEGMIDNGVLNMNYVYFAVIKFVLVPTLIMWYSRKSSFVNKQHMTPFVCAFILMGLGCISYQVMFQRYTNYFFIFFIIYCANYLSTIRRSSKLLSFLVFMMMLIPFSYEKIRADNLIIWIPYHSVFDPVDEPLREWMWGG